MRLEDQLIWIGRFVTLKSEDCICLIVFFFLQEMERAAQRLTASIGYMGPSATGRTFQLWDQMLRCRNRGIFVQREDQPVSGPERRTGLLSYKTL